MNNIFVEINGIKYESLEFCEVSESIETLCGGFFFKMTDPRMVDFDFTTGDNIKIFINDFLAKTGVITEIKGSVNNKSQDIYVKGYDTAYPLTISTLDGSIEFKSPITLKSMIEKCLSFLGMNLSVIDTVGLDKFSENEIISGNVGENIFSFLNKYASRSQVLITSNREGNIELIRAGTNEEDFSFISVVGCEENNVFKSEIVLSEEKRFNEYSFYSQANISNGIIESNFNSRNYKTYDNSASESHRLSLVTSGCDDIGTLRKKAIWQRNIIKARSNFYRTTIKSFGFGDELFKKNVLVNVADEYWKIYKRMLIKNITFFFSLKGSHSIIELVDKKTYSLDDINSLNSAERNLKENSKFGET